MASASRLLRLETGWRASTAGALPQNLASSSSTSPARPSPQRHSSRPSPQRRSAAARMWLTSSASGSPLTSTSPHSIASLLLVLALFSRLEHLAAKPAVVQLDRPPRTLAVPPLVWQARVWPRSWGSLPPLLLLVTQLPAAEVLGALLRGKQGFQLLLALSYKISESVC